MEELLTSSMYERARELGLQRVLDAVNGNKAEQKQFSNASSLDRISNFDEQGKIINEVLATVVSRILISCINEKYLIQWYAHYQADSAYHYLLEEEEEVLRIVAEDLGTHYETEDDNTSDTGDGQERGPVYLVKFPDYLRHSRDLKTSAWKLVNREVDHGVVKLRREQFVRLMMEAVRQLVNDPENEFIRPVTDEILTQFKPWLGEIRSAVETKKAQFAEFAAGEVDVEQFPPCIKALIGKIGVGENISHEGRFAIVSFLNTIGMTKDDVIKVFSTAPDFDITKSQYQIDHIIGEISGTQYTPPECSTMKSFGNCVNPDKMCGKDWLNHPLNYYRIKMKHKKKDDERAEAEEKRRAEAEAKRKAAEGEKEESGEKEDANGEEDGSQQEAIEGGSEDSSRED